MPEFLSHTTAVSRWLVIPRATKSWGVASTSTIAADTARRALYQISVASCSTHPCRGMICLCSNCAEAQMLPSWLTMTHRVEVVPWSSAAIKRGVPIRTTVQEYAQHQLQH